MLCYILLWVLCYRLNTSVVLHSAMGVVLQAEYECCVKDCCYDSVVLQTAVMTVLCYRLLL